MRQEFVQTGQWLRARSANSTLYPQVPAETSLTEPPRGGEGLSAHRPCKGSC
jgi:hypothetical protein